MLDRPVEGMHYPGSLTALRSWFPDDEACLDYLDWLRWPRGFVCPHCESEQAWPLPDGRRSCGGCRRRVSVTAGTIFHRTRTPMTVWFEVAWLMTTSKAGTSALNVQRVVGLGSYQTAWAMLHRYRSAMAAPGRDKLSGQVEVDEALYGGKDKPGPRGRGAAGKVLVAGAIEHRPDGRRGFGRARLSIIPAATAEALGAFIGENVAAGSTIITDGWGSYPRAVSGNGIEHEPTNISGSGQHAHELLPGVHRLFSLSKRWLEGTHQGAAEAAHLQAYLDEFVFRFNRRTARHRGLLFLRLLERAVSTGPATYAAIVANPHPTDRKITPPGQRSLPKSLTALPIGRPWRQAP